MGHTICLLTATLFAGQTGDAKTSRQTKVIAPQPSAAAHEQPYQNRSTLMTIRQWWQENRPNLLQRFQNRTSGRSAPNANYPQNRAPYRTQFRPNQIRKTPGVPARVKTTEPPLADGKQSVANYQPTGDTRDVPVPHLRLSEKIANSVGAGENHTWITGQLRKHGRHWVLIYAPENVIDRYQGRVVLNADVDMSKFRDGEVVHVRGAGQDRQVDGMHLYRVNSIDRIPEVK